MRIESRFRSRLAEPILALILVPLIGAGLVGNACSARDDATASASKDSSRSSERPERSLPPPFDDTAVPEPRLFAPGVVSTGDYELNAAFGPDLGEIYFCKASPVFPFPNTWSVILRSRWRDDRWSEPEVAPFSGIYSDIDPYFSPDFERLFFMSNRPRQGTEPADFDLWYVERHGNGWSEPVHTGPTVNSSEMEGYPAVAADGSLYFFSTRAGGLGPADIYVAEPTDEGYGEPRNLGPAINSAALDTNVFVAPDESYMIFSSSREAREENPFARMDLQVSFRRDGAWQPAESLGAAVNTDGWEYAPMVSPDGRYLFFARAAPPADLRHADPEPISYHELVEVIRGPGNGLGDIYYVELAALRTEWRR